jgi:hypothetical protein
MRLALAVLLSLALYLPTLATDKLSADILGRWVGGTWPLEGKMLATGFSNPATLNGTSRCSWSPDQVFVLCDQELFVDGKSERNLGVYSFDPNTASYHYVELSPGGRKPSVSDLIISADGNRWEYRGAEDVKGKLVQFRSVNEYAGPDHITWWTEYSTDNGVHWTKMNSGTETRKP